MKYNVGDRFISISKDHKACFEAYIIKSITDTQGYVVQYINSHLDDSSIPEWLIDGDILCAKVKYERNPFVINLTKDQINEVLNLEPKPICAHSNKYLNKVFTMSFWVCPDCKKEL